MTLKEALAYNRNNGKALLAANFYNFETLKGILLAVKESNASIILQLSESSIDYLGLSNAVALARSMIKYYGVQGWLHLDHGSSIEMVQQCLEEGFDSVMIDASERPLNENIEISARVVELAAKYGANVEAELGFVAKLGQQQETDDFTKPTDAKYFVEQTGVNALAIAIGSAHGFYKKPPNLRIDILREIYKATTAALVLHGSSGIPSSMISEAVKYGITKVNLATETKNAFMQELKSLLMNTNEIDLRKVFPPATMKVKELIELKLNILMQ